MDQNARLLRVSYPDGLDRHTQRCVDAIAERLMDVLGDADTIGLVVEVTLDPGTPLAQGNYYPHIKIRERKDLGMKRESECKSAAAFDAMRDASERAEKAGRKHTLPEDFE